MRESEIIHLLDGLIHLDSINIEEKIKESLPSKISDAEFFIDLSKCQFAELGALMELIIFCKNLLKARKSLFVALPTIVLTTKQSKSTTNSDWSKVALKKQRSSNNFIKKTGFVNVLQEIANIHESHIYFTEHFDYRQKGFDLDIESFEESFSVLIDDIVLKEINYKFLFPFKLINCDNHLSEIKEIETQLNKLLQNKDRGIDSFDVKVIRNVILAELVKNVRVHSNSKYAVFAVGLIQSNSYKKNRSKKKFNPIEKDHVSHISQNNIKSQVELHFGDTGVGLLNDEYKIKTGNQFNVALTDNKNQLKFAFNKWSTIQDNEERRGTKGLYRLKRLVEKYQGILHIKTAKSNGGFFNGNFYYKKNKYSLNGTLINVKLNPYKELKTFKLSNNPYAGNSQWVSEKFHLTKTLDCLPLIKKKILKENNLLLLLDISRLDLSLESKYFEYFLYEISFIAHPSEIVIYLVDNQKGIDNEAIDSYIDSVQSRIKLSSSNELNPEENDPNFEEVHDPVLVIGANNETFWYGGSEAVITILNESYNNLKNGRILRIDQIESFKNLNEGKKDQIKKHLASNSNLVVLDTNENITFNFNGIENHYFQKLRNYKPELSNKTICTPKVSIVREWLDIEQLLKDDEYGFALCLYLIYRKYYETHIDAIDKIDKRNTFLLIDNSQQYNLCVKFSELLGIKRKNILNIEEEINTSIPRRTKLFNDSAEVIVFTTVVSSSETIRRLVKYIKRDLAYPQVILCLKNSRTYYVNKLETWNEKTDIISIQEENSNPTQKLERGLNYFKEKHEKLNELEIIIGPDYQLEDDFRLNNSIVVSKELLNYISNNKVLHYNHYGKNNRRHFTFYLDKLQILNTEDPIIINKVNASIIQWVEKNAFEDYTIYVNETLLQEDFTFFERINIEFPNRVKSIDVEKDSITSKNAIYFDFGILTGESINKLLANIEGVSNLHICILFNQSINSNADILKKIKTLETFQQSDLFSSYGIITNFEISYLFDLPLSYFLSYSCPICEHRNSLDFFIRDLNIEYLKEFALDRRQRLKINTTNAIAEIRHPMDFYYSKKIEEENQELSNKIIFQMYEFKILLENAVILTKYRIELFNFLYKSLLNIKEELKNSESKIFSILYYLSIEVNWLQRDPLVFRDFRILLSNISLVIASTKLSVLISYFKTTNKYEISNLNLATRYKFAAISVLRSSNKLLFCRNISRIIESSIFNLKCSNNLLQNTLFHISSLYKNKYNKSEIYYLEIEKNLKAVIDENHFLSDAQIKGVKQVLKESYPNRSKLIRLSEESKHFKLMKDNWTSIYVTDMPKHPEPFQEWEGLSLEPFKNTFYRIQTSTTQTTELVLLTELISKLPNHSLNLKNIISNNALVFFSEKLPLLVESKYYNTHYSNKLNPKRANDSFEKLDKLIEIINRDIIKYINYQNDYNEKLNHLYNDFIKKQGLSKSSSDSTFFNLINDFPLNLIDTLNTIFKKELFPKLSLSVNYKGVLDINLGSSIKVYFPRSIFIQHLELIYRNISEKLNSDSNLTDVDLRFNVNVNNDEFVELEIKYDQTDKWKKQPNSNGSLKVFGEHIKDFGGTFIYTKCTETEKFFKINFKLLRYD